jgi:hypothetical protein
MLMPVALGLAVLQTGGGAGLLWDVRGSLAVVTALLFTFILVLAYGIWLGLDIDCDCFPLLASVKPKTTLQESLVRDLVLLGLCGCLYFRRGEAAGGPASTE